MDWPPKDEDKTAAWELYIELITRAATQGLDPEEGDEAAALASVHQLFTLTRETIKRKGRSCITFTRIAVVVINQKVRPFTAKWHPRVLAGSLDAAARKNRAEGSVALLPENILQCRGQPHPRLLELLDHFRPILR